MAAAKAAIENRQTCLLSKEIREDYWFDPRELPSQAEVTCLTPAELAALTQKAWEQARQATP